jgi:Zn-dependent peptidase ImmA (M78 family)
MPRTAKSILKQYWNRAIPIHVDALKWFAAKLHVSVLAHVRHDDFCGEYLPSGPKEGDPPSIVYNVRKPDARQSFTIAHCLGHHVLGHGKRPKETGYSAHTPDQREKDANAFAAELLMPEEAVREYIHQFHMENNLSLEALSRHFLVELAVMTFRLHSLGIEMEKIAAPSLKRFGHEKSKLHASYYYHGKHYIAGSRS